LIPPKPERPTREELLQSWSVTTSYLEAAGKEIEGNRLATYRDWLAHNELELALDELEGLGEPIQTVLFWQNLLSAADNMGLAEHAARYRRKLDEPRG